MKVISLAILILCCVAISKNVQKRYNDAGEEQKTFTVKNSDAYKVIFKASSNTNPSEIVDTIIIYSRSENIAQQMLKNKKTKLGFKSLEILTIKRASPQEIRRYLELDKYYSTPKSTDSSNYGIKKAVIDRGPGVYFVMVQIILNNNNKVIEEFEIEYSSKESTALAKAKNRAKAKYRNRYKSVSILSAIKK